MKELGMMLCLLKALDGLKEKYDEIDLDADNREPPNFADPNMKTYRHGTWRFASREALSIDELDTLKGLLVQMQTSFFPSLQQELADLLESLDITDL
ncbi:hypothetical protein PTTG_27584 [Puccinia triticina 1-1 BBBD Race 1]|uniref:Uncharacterized protein n=1 Tax=Puccinia triticina (isolate 1-1 / race 1 (BBBD)) TaxID=630390 RepID=A0A180GIQ8_PUCT1|nr:hypothetical protein PTTG_27584 [Puccinia triticina 1-1 BBBD Race 1]WAR53368.1 hypothetical protein PtB15_2B799 [Puccinia triticina]